MLQSLWENRIPVAAVVLFAVGFSTLLLHRNLFKKIIGLNIMDTAAYLFLTSLGYISGRRADVIVLDPPRKGCEESVLDAILGAEPKRIVYVSCDPATLARDLKILCGSGQYQLERVCPVDQFGHTVHVESCVLLQRVSNTR